MSARSEPRPTVGEVAKVLGGVGVLLARDPVGTTKLLAKTVRDTYREWRAEQKAAGR